MGLLDVNDEESMFQQTAVYWAPARPDSRGQPTWLSPVEIACRWDDEFIEKLTDTDEVLDVGAKVYVGQDVVRGGMLFLGLLTSSMTALARNTVGAREIMKFTKAPNRDVDRFLRVAYLARS